MKTTLKRSKHKTCNLVGMIDVPSGYEVINGNIVHHTAQINWDRVNIGFGNKIGPFCVIGGEAQHRHYSSCGEISVGDCNIFHEHTSVSLPTKISKITKIQSRCVFMASTVVHHDCLIEDDVTVSSNVSLGGSVIVMRGANIGMNAAVHQFKIIGSYSIIGMNGCVVKGSQIRPGRKYAGVPVKDIGINSLALSRAKITDKLLQEERRRFDAFDKYFDFGAGG